MDSLTSMVLSEYFLQIYKKYLTKANNSEAYT